MNPYSALPFLNTLVKLMREQLATYAPTVEPILWLTQPDGAGASPLTGWDADTLGAGLPFFTRAEVTGGASGSGAKIELEIDPVSGVINDVIIQDGGEGYTPLSSGIYPYPIVICKPYLNWVYNNIPSVFSKSPPFAFLDYIEGVHKRTGFNRGGIHGGQVTHTVEWNVCQALAKDVTTADAMANAFIGVAFDFIRRNDTIGGTVDRATAIRNRVEALTVNGGQSGGVVYLTNIITIEIEQMIEN